MKVQWRQDHMAEEEAGTEGPPMAPYPTELEGCPPTVPETQGTDYRTWKKTLTACSRETQHISKHRLNVFKRMNQRQNGVCSMSCCWSLVYVRTVWFCSDSLHSCSMVAHCSDFFQVCARSSLEVFTASSSNPMLSCNKHKTQNHQPAQETGNKTSCRVCVSGASVLWTICEHLIRQLGHRKMISLFFSSQIKRTENGLNKGSEWKRPHTTDHFQMWSSTSYDWKQRRLWSVDLLSEAWLHWWRGRGADGSRTRCPRKLWRCTGTGTWLNCGSPAQTHTHTHTHTQHKMCNFLSSGVLGCKHEGKSGQKKKLWIAAAATMRLLSNYPQLYKTCDDH